MRKLIHPTKAGSDVGWGKTRAQRAPHPNTPISQQPPKPHPGSRYGYSNHTQNPIMAPVGWISLSASTNPTNLSAKHRDINVHRWWMRKLIHPTGAKM